MNHGNACIFIARQGIRPRIVGSIDDRRRTRRGVAHADVAAQRSVVHVMDVKGFGVPPHRGRQPRVELNGACIALTTDWGSRQSSAIPASQSGQRIGRG